MVDDWLLEHLAKVTTVSCVLIVIYFLVYSIWRISRMPNNPWNWSEWQWPLGGRHAVEIYRKPTEMPFTLSLNDSCTEDMNKITFTLKYLENKPPPEVTVMWGPAVPYLMRLINSPWTELGYALMIHQLDEGQWHSFDSEELQDHGGGTNGSTSQQASFFILHRLNLSECEECTESSDPLISETYRQLKLTVLPPVEFDWNLLRNQYRYPAAVFVTSCKDATYTELAYSISGIIQIAHVKNELIPKSSRTLAQYIKMNNGQCHILQSLYVMDDIRATEDDDAETTSDLTTQTEEPFRDVLCSVCQVSRVTRVIIPCRHVCLCSQCFDKVECCPICRGHIMYYFKTRSESTPAGLDTRSNDEPHQLSWRQRIDSWNDRFNAAVGVIRQ